MSLTPQIIELIKSGYSNTDIANEAGCSTHYVRAVRSRSGFTKEHRANRIRRKISKLECELEAMRKELVTLLNNNS